MKIRVTFLVLAIVAFGSRSPAADKKPETSRLVFVTEFIHELGAVEDIREKGQRELKEDPSSPFPNMIHTGTLMKLELGSEIRMLNTMHLNDPFDELIPNITSFYKEKISLWDRMSEIGRTFISGPKAGVDYSKLLAEMPEMRARLEYVDESLFKAAPMVFATLIDMKPDSKNQTSHLIITKAEREKLIDNLKTEFGAKLDEKEQNYLVSAASVLKAYLLKDFKSSDEPWE